MFRKTVGSSSGKPFSKIHNNNSNFKNIDNGGDKDKNKELLKKQFKEQFKDKTRDMDKDIGKDTGKDTEKDINLNDGIKNNSGSATPVIVSNEIIEYSIKLLQEIDPKQSLNKHQLVSILEEMLLKCEELFKVETINYILNQLEDIEEKLEELEVHRGEDTTKIWSSKTKLSADVFRAKIVLDSDEKPDVDESEQTFIKAKMVYSSQNYKSLPDDKKKEIMNKIKFKKKLDTKYKEKYLI